MQGLQKVAGVRSLRSIVARASSARVVDLHTLAIEAWDEPGYHDRPMFDHPLLNRAIIAKHHIQPGELGRWTDRRLLATKVIFPFDVRDLGLGGQFLFVDGPDFLGQLARHLDYSDLHMDRDVEILRLLDRLPTLDPFLIRERLSERRYDVASCYFRLSAQDRNQMTAFVAGQVEALIRLCFTHATQHDDEAKRLSTLLLGAGDAPQLEPLRQTLQMTSDAFAEAMFCWKAVLYYRWRSRALGPSLRATQSSIADIRKQKQGPAAGPFVRAAAEQLEEAISDSGRAIAEAFRLYEEAYEALTQRGSPQDFRRFLVDGARLFAHVGERMGRLEQLISFWKHLFPTGRTRVLPPEAMLDALRDLLYDLSIVPEVSHGYRLEGAARLCA